jgi:hypothetical protein
VQIFAIKGQDVRISRKKAQSLLELTAITAIAQPTAADEVITILDAPTSILARLPRAARAAHVIREPLVFITAFALIQVQTLRFSDFSVHSRIVSLTHEDGTNSSITFRSTRDLRVIAGSVGATVNADASDVSTCVFVVQVWITASFLSVSFKLAICAMIALRTFAPRTKLLMVKTHSSIQTVPSIGCIAKTVSFSAVYSMPTRSAVAFIIWCSI